MKLISCLLVLATLSLCLTSQVDYRQNKYAHKDTKPFFVVLADSEIKHNKLVSSLLVFGSAQVLTSACSSQQLFVAADFKISQIHEVSKWSDKTKSHYKFAVRHTHSHRPELYIESRFTVEYLLSGAVSVTVSQRSSIIFSDYSIKFDETITLQSAYKLVPASQHRNSLIQQLLGHGNGYVCGQARHRNQLVRLPATIANLDVLLINKVAFRRLDDITYYRYDVVLGDAGHKSYRVDATFIVMLCRNTGRYSIVSVEYTVRDLVSNKQCCQSDYHSDSSDSDSDCSDNYSHKDSSDSSDSDCDYNSKKSKKRDSKSDSDCTDKRVSDSKKDCSDSKKDSSDRHSDDDCTDKHRSASKKDCSDRHSDDDCTDKHRSNSKKDCSDNKKSDRHSAPQWSNKH